MQIKVALQKAKQGLKNQVKNPELDSEKILAHTLNESHTWVIAHPEYEFDPQKFFLLIQSRQAGKPLAYILGKQEFYGREFVTTPEVLIPRPETESIVEYTLPEIKDNDKIIDVGTGSGALAITLKLEKPKTQIHASEISPTALEVAHQNAKRLQADLHFHQIDDFFPPNISFDIVVTNLPYIPTKDPSIQKSVADYEPSLALFGGSDGLDIYRKFFQKLSKQDWQPRFLMCEMGYNQAEKLSEIVLTKFPKAKIETIKDHAGFDRNLIIRFN